MDIKALSSVALNRPAPMPPARDAAPGAEPSAPSSNDPTAASFYLSPVFRYDNAAHVAIMAFRDGTTGEVTRQIPPERVVAEYRRNGGKTASVMRESGDAPSSGGDASAVPETVSGPQAPGGFTSPGQAAALGTMQTAQAVSPMTSVSAPVPSGGTTPSGSGRSVSLSV